MIASKTASPAPLRIFCVEDNPLILFHIEQLIADAGHVFLGSAGSLGELKADFKTGEVDGVLVDIDLTDGRTGPEAAGWLKRQGVPSIFVTGQEDVAAQYADEVLGIVVKPICAVEMAKKIELFREFKNIVQ
jgi:AmiR/NasT family two-component response regulator